MYRILIMATVLVALMACHKEKEVPEKSRALLLTQEPWILASHGQDENSNGIIDQGEESIQPCQLDNTYTFHPDGKGKFNENASSCGGAGETVFTWKFTQDGRGLDFLYAFCEILVLDENQLLLALNEPGSGTGLPRYLMRFRH